MDSPAETHPAREPFGRGLARAIGFSVVAAAAIGGFEALKLLYQGATRNYPAWSVDTFAISVGGYALIAVPLGALAYVAARVLWGRPGHRSALPSACAGLGTTLALAAYVLTSQIGLALLPLAVIACTLLCVALRELLAWWSAATRVRGWETLAEGAMVLAFVEIARKSSLGWGWAAGFLALWFVLKVAAGIFERLAPRATLSRGVGVVARWVFPAAALAAIRFAPLASSEASAVKPGPNVLLLSIDTLRADHVGCYGNKTVRTPNIDALAQQGALFETAISQANITGPSHTTMLTGLTPAEHGVLANGQPLPHSTPTIVETLGAAGYQTAGFISGFTLENGACGFAPRFDWYDDDLLEWVWMPEAASRLRLFKDVIRVLDARGRHVRRADRRAGETVASFQRWFARRDADRPFFAFVHFYDPHCPYRPPEPYARMYDPAWKGDPYVNWYTLSTEQRRELVASPDGVAHQIALHEGEISYADEQAGRVLDMLERAGELDRTLVVLTSDHGEELGEHAIYFDHGSTLYDTELHVPLIVRLPGRERAGTRVAAQVRLTDIAPTILELTGVAAATAPSGHSLMPLIESASGEARPALSFNDLPGVMSDYDLDGRGLSLRQQGLKWIWTSDYWLDSEHVPERWELYDLAQDPLETRNLAGDAPPAAAEGRARLEALIQATAHLGRKGQMDPQVREQLRLLGY